MNSTDKPTLKLSDCMRANGERLVLNGAITIAAKMDTLAYGVAEDTLERVADAIGIRSSLVREVFCTCPELEAYRLATNKARTRYVYGSKETIAALREGEGIDG